MLLLLFLLCFVAQCCVSSSVGLVWAERAFSEPEYRLSVWRWQKLCYHLIVAINFSSSELLRLPLVNVWRLLVFVVFSIICSAKIYSITAAATTPFASANIRPGIVTEQKREKNGTCSKRNIYYNEMASMPCTQYNYYTSDTDLLLLFVAVEMCSFSSAGASSQVCTAQTIIYSNKQEKTQKNRRRGKERRKRWDESDEHATKETRTNTNATCCRLLLVLLMVLLLQLLNAF